jgi:hypothetical protein
MVAAAALLAGIAIAAPMAASSAADGTSQVAQAGPGPQSGMAHMGMGRNSDGNSSDGNGDDNNAWGDHGPMGHHRMRGWMHRMTSLSPQQRCEEHIAKRAGMIAYTIAKLNLTDQQRPLWDKVQAPLQQAADKERQLCATLKPRDQRGQETVLDRMNRREQFLSAKLQTIQQTKPALEQFYQSLSPEQKTTIDHPFMHR